MALLPLLFLPTATPNPNRKACTRRSALNPHTSIPPLFQVEGIKPFCAIYSTFMQRAYDQLIHDVAIQKLPVRFILDRAGLVGNDGPTHHGSFDLAYIGCVPNMVICSPSDEVELKNMVQTVYEIDDKPSALRYPRGSALGLDTLNDLFGYGLAAYPERGTALPIGKGRIMRQASSKSKRKVAILSFGTRLAEAVQAARAIEADDAEIGVTVADARWMKPLDTEMVARLAEEHEVSDLLQPRGPFPAFPTSAFQFLSRTPEHRAPAAHPPSPNLAPIICFKQP